ncbi:CAP domain-containing protein, partial [Protomyces lactucae-debilis]
AFIEAMLSAHNTMRSFHTGTGNLTWNADLANAAKKQLDTHVFAHSNQGYGENLAYFYMSPTNNQNPRHAVQLWYDEISQYNYASPGFSSATGHFTQVVWKGTTQVGCAWDRGYDDYTANHRFLTCEYSTPGNYGGQFASQV